MEGTGVSLGVLVVSVACSVVSASIVIVASVDLLTVVNSAASASTVA